MHGNRGQTSLKTKRRAANPMQDFDRLPPELRAWMAEAVLPWRAASVQRAYVKALARVKDPQKALRELDRIQSGMIAKDAVRVWGADHPVAEKINARKCR